MKKLMIVSPVIAFCRVSSLLLFLCCMPILLAAQQGLRKPLVLGHTVTLPSKLLSEDRMLNVYLPPGYDQNDSVRYPVIYLLDGGTDEDFIHVVGLVQFNNFPWIHQVPESIVIGIVNVDRRRDFTSRPSIAEKLEGFQTAGGSANFIAFLEKELQPFVERNYRVNSSRTLIGQSLGGLLATEVLLKHPQLFDRYVIISPSLWWNDGALLRESSVVYSEAFVRPTRVYIGVGKEGLAPGSSPHVMEVDANILSDKLKAGKSKGLQVHFDYLPAENHATISHPAIFNAFRLLFDKER